MLVQSHLMRELPVVIHVGEAHDQAVRCGIAAGQPLHGLQQQFCALIRRQQAKVDEQWPASGQIEPVTERSQLLRRPFSARPKLCRINGVGQGGDALRGHLGSIDQLAGRLG